MLVWTRHWTRRPEKVDHRRSFSQPQAKHSLLMMLIMMIQRREIAALYAKIWSQWILKYLLQASLFSRLSDNIHLNMEREARQNVNYVAGRSLAFTADLQARILCRQLPKIRLVLLSSCVNISCSFFWFEIQNISPEVTNPILIEMQNPHTVLRCW